MAATLVKIRTNASFLEFAALLRELTPFDSHGAMSASAGRAISTGQLPGEFRAAASADTVDYVVFSYATPIAWHDTVTGWTVPDVRYSVTTSRHQGRIGAAVSVL